MTNLFSPHLHSFTDSLPLVPLHLFAYPFHLQLHNIQYAGVSIMDSTTPTYSQLCDHCEKEHVYLDYDVLFRGRRIGMTLNCTDFQGKL